MKLSSLSTVSSSIAAVPKVGQVQHDSRVTVAVHSSIAAVP